MKRKAKYTHIVMQLGWFRFSLYRLGSRFSIRLEIAKGWD